MKKIILAIKLLLCRIGAGAIFIIEIKDSKVRHVSGDKNNKFINDCKDIVKTNNLTIGLIYVVRDSNGKTRIKTSSEIPKPSAQRLRNLWSFYS